MVRSYSFQQMNDVGRLACADSGVGLNQPRASGIRAPGLQPITRNVRAAGVNVQGSPFQNCFDLPSRQAGILLQHQRDNADDMRGCHTRAAGIEKVARIIAVQITLTI